MRHKFITMTPDLHDYVIASCTDKDPLLKELAEETARLGGIAAMQISPEQGAFMTLLARSIGARSIVEIGTFTGYSSLCLARALPEGGRLLACDVSEEWTGIARRYWERAGLADRIELRLGPALETLRALPAEAAFDLAFIDADKGNYRGYYEELLPRMRQGGLILFDNVLWSGHVADPAQGDANTVALRELNQALASDPRVEVVMLPISDGVSIARKR